MRVVGSGTENAQRVRASVARSPRTGSLSRRQEKLGDRLFPAAPNR